MLCSPRYNDDGVKVRHDGGAWFCGNCGACVAQTWGFAVDGVDCTGCGMHVRCDFRADLPSEILERLLETPGLSYDAANVVIDQLRTIRNLERESQWLDDLLFPNGQQTMPAAYMRV